MSNDSHFHPRVYSTGDGERSTAGSNYGDWRPDHPSPPHGYDFEQRFDQGPTEWAALDPDYRRLRDEHERELDAHYPHWVEMRRKHFNEDFNQWRKERSESPDAHGKR